MRNNKTPLFSRIGFAVKFIRLTNVSKFAGGGDMTGIGSLISIEALLNSVNVAIPRYLEQRETAKDQRLEQLRITLDFIKEISMLHLKAIHEVTKPLVVQHDFLTSYQLFHQLFNTTDFQNGYAEIYGILNEANGWPESSRNENFYTGLKKVRICVRNFQYGTFAISRDEAFRDEAHQGKAAIISSFPINEHFKRSKLLYNVFTDPNSRYEEDQIPQLRQEILSNFSTAFCYVQFMHEENNFPPKSCTLDSLDDFISLHSQWFIAWQRAAEMRLFADDGMYATIGDFEGIMKTI